ncbi:MAG: response regulator [Anaerolineae bacterium]|nr:response regulator [Anaerolineae bacterium]
MDSDSWPAARARTAGVTSLRRSMFGSMAGSALKPSFSTKDKGKGTGLGLATVYGIVKQSKGGISVSSEVGKGTTFDIYLPREPSVSPLSTQALLGRSKATGTETILLVEDEDELRSVAKRALEVAGYSVLSASDGEVALRIAEESPGAIHLLLTDVVMPRLGGRALAGKLKRKRPDIVVLYMSGYTDDAIIRHDLLDAGVQLLAKPFTGSELTEKVRQVLDGAGASGEGGHRALREPAGPARRPKELVALAALSEGTLGDICVAAMTARHDELVEIIERLRSSAPELAGVLQQRADCFDYESILHLVRRRGVGSTSR